MDVPWQPAMADEITITADTIVATIAPQRGALITGCTVAGTQLLHQDYSELADPARSAHSGIPVLFPNAGRLHEDRFLLKQTSLPQHGFARRYPWEIAEQGPDKITLHLPIGPAIQAQFPFAIDVTMTIQVQAHMLRVALNIRNQDTQTVPIAPGWHPYFRVPHTAKDHVRSRALGATVQRFTDAAEFDLNVPFTDNTCDLAIPGLPPLTLRSSADIRTLQIWSPPGANYICIEPWVGPANALNEEAQHLLLEPGTTREIWMEIVVG